VNAPTAASLIFELCLVMLARWFILHVWCFLPQWILAQEVELSTPQKVNTGISRVEILGKTSQGILVRHTEKEEDHVLAFSGELRLNWSRRIPINEKNAEIREIFTTPDSITFFFTVVNKGVTVLKAIRTSARLESNARLVVCDTLSRNFLVAPTQAQFALGADKRSVFYWFPDPNFENNELIHLRMLNGLLQRQWELTYRVKGFENPEVLSGVVDSANNVLLVVGEYKDRSVRNDFPFTALMMVSLREKGNKIRSHVLRTNDLFYSAPLTKLDAFTGDVAIAGLYGHSAGVESRGFYLLKYSGARDTLHLQSHLPHTTEFLSQLTGSPAPRKSDGFYNFQPVELIVKRDGGAVILAEAQSATSEAMGSAGMSGFGFSSGFIVNSFHYDEIAVISANAEGRADWKTILHKKQETEGDGGYYSSFSTMISGNKAFFVYNDEFNGQSVVSYYSLDRAGNQARTELFNSERKGVMPVMKLAKQISANELVIPSLKRNYLQFIKITF
jgi:hypothetical protein